MSLLKERGLEPVVIEYLLTPPSATELKALLKKLNLRPEELVRKSEPIYQTQLAGKNLTNAQLIAAMVDNPILIERPIVVLGDRAVLGRPPENVLLLLK